ncbi:radical SAM protein [bacterium]|nr:radical SAM protein [bacterium]
MKILAKAGDENIAVVYIAQFENERLIEFVESVQPPLPREDKWVLIISTLYGCPVGCRFCDAGNFFLGKLSIRELLAQIDYIITKRFPDRRIPVKKFKIQFARMGDPALNPHVLDVLEALPQLYDAPGLVPSISSIAPETCDRFFERLLDIKKRYYRERFQLQFSIHTTDEVRRDWLIPVRKWSFEKIADYSNRFFDSGGKKIALNFALAQDMPIEVDVLLRHFNPEQFLIKITPVNPTYRAKENGIASYILPESEDYGIISALRDSGYEVILSIGELTENDIGSNCGQHIMNYLREKSNIKGGYTYPLSFLNGTTTSIL